MRRDELITKLARELPHWPAGLNKEQLDKLIAPILMPEHANEYLGCVDNWGKNEAYLYNWNITRADYLAECDRLGVTAPEPMPGPVKSTWDGEGLPPVGSRVLIEQSKVPAAPGTICYISGNAVVWQWDEMVGTDTTCAAYHDSGRISFRPLRSEEDIAVDKMVEAIVAHYEYPKGAEAYLGLARTLYRAGYRQAGGDA